jgi:hypothetical protein
VHESKTLFDGIEQETQPLNTFINTLYALDWQKLDKADETAIRAWSFALRASTTLSIQSKDAIDGVQFGRLDQLGVRDRD